MKRGYRTLLVERAAQVDGRASTVGIDGFGINTGAQIFELGGANKELFDELGVPCGPAVRPSRWCFAWGNIGPVAAGQLVTAAQWPVGYLR